MSDQFIYIREYEAQQEAAQEQYEEIKRKEQKAKIKNKSKK